MTQEALKLAEIIEHFDSNDESLPLELLKEISATLRALAQPEQEPVALHKSGIANSPSDPEICNERSAQACGPVYCGDSGGYCNKCPKQKTIQAVKQCKGMNCGCTDGRSHSLECLAELAAAIAGGVFVQKALAEHTMREVQQLGQEIEPKIGCVNHDCERCKAQPEQEPVAWPCLIDSADFSENTITLVMQCEDYKVSAGTHWLSTTPLKEKNT